jgi:hypothetical protein
VLFSTVSPRPAVETKPAASNRGSDRHFLSGEPEGRFTDPDWGLSAVFSTGRSTKGVEKSAFKSPCVQKKNYSFRILTIVQPSECAYRKALAAPQTVNPSVSQVTMMIISFLRPWLQAAKIACDADGRLSVNS